MHGRGNDIVGGLAQVHLVIGMNPAGAQIAAQDLRGPVGDDFVGVGVGGSAGAGLKNIQDEVTVEPPVNHFLGRRDDGVADGFVQDAQSHIGLGRRLLDQAQGADKGAGKAQVADGKVQHRPHRRGPVQGIGRHLHFAHRIPFNPQAGVAGGHCLPTILKGLALKIGP